MKCGRKQEGLAFVMVNGLDVVVNGIVLNRNIGIFLNITEKMAFKVFGVGRDHVN